MVSIINLSTPTNVERKDSRTRFVLKSPKTPIHTPPKVLIVDDSTYNLFVMKELIS